MGKVSLAIGLGVGYVLGARAGRERYEQIQQAATRLSGRPEVQQAVEKVRDSLPPQIQDAVDGVVQRASSGGTGTGTGSDTGTPEAATSTLAAGTSAPGAGISTAGTATSTPGAAAAAGSALPLEDEQVVVTPTTTTVTEGKARNLRDDQLLA